MYEIPRSSSSSQSLLPSSSHHIDDLIRASSEAPSLETISLSSHSSLQVSFVSSHIKDCHDCHLVGCAGVPLDTGGQVCLHVASLHSLRPRVWGPVHFLNDGWDVGKLQINILLSDPCLFRLESGPILLAALGQPHSWVLKSWKGDCT